MTHPRPWPDGQVPQRPTPILVIGFCNPLGDRSAIRGSDRFLAHAIHLRPASHVLEGLRAEESALRSARENELLALAVRALVACSDESAVFDVIEEFFLNLTPESIVLVNRTTPDREWVTVRSALGIEDGALSSATAVLGFNVVGSTWSIKEQDWDRFFAPVLTEVEGGLTQLIGAVVPEPGRRLRAESTRDPSRVRHRHSRRGDRTGQCVHLQPSAAHRDAGPRRRGVHLPVLRDASENRDEWRA